LCPKTSAPQCCRKRIGPWQLGLVGVMGAGGVAVATGAAGATVAALKAYLSNSVLASSGFLAAFSLIFASELGDKTFFIAALLAMRMGKWVSFIGKLGNLCICIQDEGLCRAPLKWIGVPCCKCMMQCVMCRFSCCPFCDDSGFGRYWACCETGARCASEQ
jgi:hypothetical protein